MMARAHPQLALRPFLPADVPMLAEIFRASIEELTADDYSETQREAWATMAQDEVAFGARLAKGLTLLGTLDGSPVGFASLEGPERVTMLYVHPAAAGHGVGSMLLERTLLAARNRGLKFLHMACLADNKRMQQLARKFDAELSFDFSSVVGEVATPRPTPLSLMREILADGHGFATAMFDVQSRLLKPV